MKKRVTFVLFGATGDLATRKLVPGFLRLIRENVISNESLLLGVSRKNWSGEEYRKFLIGIMKEEKDKDILKKISLAFFSADLEKGHLEGLEGVMKKNEPKSCDRIYYLATSFHFFPSIIQALKKLGLDKQKDGLTKISFEKPFGNDLQSSEALDKEIHKIFLEDYVYRIDHYLAKETVQNLNVLKFTNPLLYGSFGNRAIESIEIIVDEDLGVGNRITYYDSAGALKDMIQSHLLQVLALLLMERPDSLAPNDIHDKKVIVLKNLEFLPAKEHLLGQYRGYAKELEEAGMKKSKTETFARIALNCKMERWDGVKLFLRTGKKLKRKYGQIRIKYKPPAKKFMLGFSGLGDNRIVIDVYPKQNITVFMNTNTPEQNLDVKPVKFEFCRDCEFGPNTPDEYSILLHEIIKGDKMLFARADEVKECWKVIEKIENMKDKIPFVYYEDGGEPEYLK